MKRFLLLLLLIAPQTAVTQSATGVVTGRVLGMDGTVAAGVRVSAVVFSASAAPTGVSVFAALAETDAAGRYRLENLPPGPYLIAAGLVGSPTYYPGVTAATSATAVVVRASATAANIDFTMALPSLLSISGRVVGSPSVSLATLRAVLIEGATATDLRADGTFTFSKVRPGNYTIQVRRTDATSVMSETASVTVLDHDVEGVELTISARFSVTAAVAVDGGGIVPRLTLILTPFLGGQSPVSMTIGVNERDARQQVPEGEYRVSLSAIPEGYYLKSFVLGSTDLLANPLKVFREGAPRIAVTLGVSSPPPWVKVSGRVTGLSNSPSPAPVRVILTGSPMINPVPDVPVTADGSFEFPMVLPGEYRARLTPMPPISPVPVTVPSRDVAGVQIAIPPLTPVTVRLSVNGNGPAPNALTLRINDSGGGAISIQGTTQPDGTFRVLAPEGTHRISLVVPGYTVQELKSGADDLMRRPMTVSAADPAELQATLVYSPGAVGEVLVSGGVLTANCISCPPPVYPELARAAGITDTVVLSVVVGKDGIPRAIRVIRGHQLLQQPAVDAVQQWRYKPQMLNGELVEIQASVSLSFVLN